MIKPILFPFLLLLPVFSVFAQEFAPGYVVAKFRSAPDIVQNDQGELEIPILKKMKGAEDLVVERHLFSFLKNKQKGQYAAFQNIYSFSFDTAKPVEKMVNILQESGLFEYVEPEYTGTSGGQKMQSPPPVFEPNDAFFSRQWNMRNDGTFNQGNPLVDADTDMDEAWNITTGSEAITMAILDSGFKMDHPELSGRYWENQGEIPGNNIDDDNNGFIDDISGWDFVNADNDPTDDHGHGTNVTGIATATGNNTIGYAGVDWQCKVMVCKILNANNSGLLSVWAEAVMYAAENGADIINMSVGGSGNSSPLRLACDFAYDSGVTIVACMMNFNNMTTYYPAGYSSTIAIGSTDMDDTRSDPFFWSGNSGSNFGPHIDAVAPGNYIYGLNYNSNSNYNTYWGGTSQATPLVAGLCGLLLAQNPALSPEEIRQLIRNGAEDQVGDGEDTPGFDLYYGYGRVNAYNTLLQLTNIKERQAANSVRVFPNPVFGSGKVQFEILEGTVVHGLQLSDVSGSLILQKEFDITGQYELNIPPQIQQGLYLAKLFGPDGTFFTKIMVR